MTQKKQTRPRSTEAIGKEIEKKKAEIEEAKRRLAELTVERRAAEQYEDELRRERATKVFEKAVAASGIVWDEETALKAAHLLAESQAQE